MDSQKILGLISDIVTAEGLFDFQANINNLITYYQQKNLEQMEATWEVIQDNFKKTPMDKYVATETKTLREMGCFGLFDSTLILRIQEILSGPGYELEQKLQVLSTERGNSLEKIKALQSSLINLGIKSDETEKDIYLVAFSLPEKYHNLENLHKATLHIDQFLKSLTVSLPKGEEDFEIYSVGNGCIEIFIKALPELANRVVYALDIILRIQGVIALFQQSQKLFEHYSKANKTKAETMAKAELQKEKEGLVAEYTKEISFKGDKADKNDAKNRIQNLFYLMVKYLEEGATIEVKTPQLQAPREITEEDTPEISEELVRQKKLYEKKVMIDDVNKRIFLLQKEELCLELPLPDNSAEDILDGTQKN